MGNTAARWHKEGMQIICLAPCVCNTPAGSAMVPVPYMIISSLADACRTVPSVLFGGEEAFTMNSRITTLKGNEPGTGGGVASGVHLGYSRPQTNKSSFYAGGYQVIQHDCVFEMNCNGPDGPSNTVGKLNYPPSS
jgi:hypothetical protein